jgi:hypothetical protein
MRRHELYMRYFEIYLELYEKLKPAMERLDGLRG